MSSIEFADAVGAVGAAGAGIVGGFVRIENEFCGD